MQSSAELCPKVPQKCKTQADRRPIPYLIKIDQYIENKNLRKKVKPSSLSHLHYGISKTNGRKEINLWMVLQNKS